MWFNYLRFGWHSNIRQKYENIEFFSHFALTFAATDIEPASGSELTFSCHVWIARIRRQRLSALFKRIPPKPVCVMGVLHSCLGTSLVYQPAVSWSTVGRHWLGCTKQGGLRAGTYPWTIRDWLGRWGSIRLKLTILSYRCIQYKLLVHAHL